MGNWCCVRRYDLLEDEESYNRKRVEMYGDEQPKFPDFSSSSSEESENPYKHTTTIDIENSIQESSKIVHEEPRIENFSLIHPPDSTKNLKQGTEVGLFACVLENFKYQTYDLGKLDGVDEMSEELKKFGFSTIKHNNMNDEEMNNFFEEFSLTLSEKIENQAETVIRNILVFYFRGKLLFDSDEEDVMLLPIDNLEDSSLTATGIISYIENISSDLSLIMVLDGPKNTNENPVEKVENLGNKNMCYIYDPLLLTTSLNGEEKKTKMCKYFRNVWKLANENKEIDLFDHLFDNLKKKNFFLFCNYKHNYCIKK